MAPAEMKDLFIILQYRCRMSWQLSELEKKRRKKAQSITFVQNLNHLVKKDIQDSDGYELT